MADVALRTAHFVAADDITEITVYRNSVIVHLDGDRRRDIAVPQGEDVVDRAREVLARAGAHHFVEVVPNRFSRARALSEYGAFDNVLHLRFGDAKRDVHTPSPQDAREAVGRIAAFRHT